jgi:hypothetical protein
MAQAWWETTSEVPKTGGDQLYLQKGFYHFHDKRPSEPGIRFIWRVNGKLQSRPARIDCINTVESLLELARRDGWKINE